MPLYLVATHGLSSTSAENSPLPSESPAARFQPSDPSWNRRSSETTPSSSRGFVFPTPRARHSRTGSVDNVVENRPVILEPRPIYLLEQLNQGPRLVDDLPPLPPSTDASRSSSVSPPKEVSRGDVSHAQDPALEPGVDGDGREPSTGQIEARNREEALDQDPLGQVASLDSLPLEVEGHVSPTTLGTSTNVENATPVEHLFGTKFTTDDLQMEPEDYSQHKEPARKEYAPDGPFEDVAVSSAVNPLLARNASKSGKKSKKKTKDKSLSKAKTFQQLDQPDLGDIQDERIASHPDSEEPKVADSGHEDQSIPEFGESTDLTKDLAQHYGSKAKGKGKKKRTLTSKAIENSPTVDSETGLSEPDAYQLRGIEEPSWSGTQAQRESANVEVLEPTTEPDIGATNTESVGKSKSMRAQSSGKKGKKKRKDTDSWMNEIETLPAADGINASRELNDRERESAAPFTVEPVDKSATKDDPHAGQEESAADMEQGADLRGTHDHAPKPTQGTEATMREQLPQTRSLPPEAVDVMAESKTVPDLDELFPDKRNKNNKKKKPVVSSSLLEDDATSPDPIVPATQFEPNQMDQESDSGNKKKKGGKARKDRKVTKAAEKFAQQNNDSIQSGEADDDSWNTGKSKKKNKKRDSQALAAEKLDYPSSAPVDVADPELDGVASLPAKPTSKAEKKRKKGKKGKSALDPQDSEDDTLPSTGRQKPVTEEPVFRALEPEAAAGQEIATVDQSLADVPRQQSREAGDEGARYPGTVAAKDDLDSGAGRFGGRVFIPSVDYQALGAATDSEAPYAHSADKFKPEILSRASLAAR